MRRGNSQKIVNSGPRPIEASISLGGCRVLAGLWLYGLRGWPLFHALLLKLFVEPAPPGEWRILQLDSKLYESEMERARQLQQQVERADLAGREPAEIEPAMRAFLTNGDAGAPADDEATLARRELVAGAAPIAGFQSGRV